MPSKPVMSVATAVMVGSPPSMSETASAIGVVAERGASVSIIWAFSPSSRANPAEVIIAAIAPELTLTAMSSTIFFQHIKMLIKNDGEGDGSGLNHIG